VNVDPAAQLRLLDLQAADTAIAQLRHKRATLPELAAIAEAAERGGALHAQVVEIETRVQDLAGEQRRLENDVEAVRTRATRDEQRLTGGGVPAKEVEGLQHELTSLARRQATLEDELLEVMEQRETADAELAELAGQQTGADTERAEQERRRDLEFAGIDHAIGIRVGDRAAIAAEIPEELLALYVKVAGNNGGVGAAGLRHRRCEGCHLELAGNELGAVRGADPTTVLRCENCRRILVRTAESGL
jgi:predicted  nucleic acid-binding Zn-ribbon protein